MLNPNLPAMLLLMLCLLSAHSVQAASRDGCWPQDLSALLAVKAQLSMSSWVGRNCCAWDSVGCSPGTGRVISVYLKSDLTAHIPAALCKLSELQSLTMVGLVGGDIPVCLGDLAELISLQLVNIDIGYESISGTIPQELCKLSKLEKLSLSPSTLEGDVPACLGNLSKLTDLALGPSELSGTIPSSLCNLNRLEVLNLFGNPLQGDIPACLGNLSKLNDLELGSNKLSGTIPSSLCNLNRLEVLNLNANSLQGGIPACFGNMSALTKLDLGSNNVSGTFPSALSGLPSLSSLDLSSNKLESRLQFNVSSSTLDTLLLSGNRFSGTLPASLSHLSLLSKLDLSSNLFIGSIPSEWANSTQIYYLALNDNCLQIEHLPSWLVNLPLLLVLELRSCGISAISCPRNASLYSLDLSDNSLSWQGLKCILGRSLQYLSLKNNSLEGKIPEEVGHMTSLTVLQLNDNSLEGQIPEWFGNMTSLRVLSLNGNNFSGHVPRLWNCGYLQLLNLGSNHFQGTLQDLTAHSNMFKLQVLVLASNRMHGSIPYNFGSFSDVLQVIDLSNNNFSGPIPLTLGLPAFFQAQAGVESKNIEGGQFYEFTISAKGSRLQFETIVVALLYLNLQGNRLTGTIPTSLGNLKYTVYLNLARNSLNGNIPASLSNLTSLESLDLSNNSLSGPIPANFSMLTALEYFSVAHNNLSGPIPQGNQFGGTFTNLSYEGNAGLCDAQACGRSPTLDRPCGRPCASPPAPQNITLPFHNRFVAFLEAYAPIPALAVGYVVGLVGTVVVFVLLRSKVWKILTLGIFQHV